MMLLKSLAVLTLNFIKTDYSSQNFLNWSFRWEMFQKSNLVILCNKISKQKNYLKTHPIYIHIALYVGLSFLLMLTLQTAYMEWINASKTQKKRRKTLLYDFDPMTTAHRNAAEQRMVS